MSAKEMFEKLGYICDISHERIRFINGGTYIIFDMEEGKYTMGCTNWLKDAWVDMKLLQAINKQVEELGWNK